MLRYPGGKLRLQKRFINPEIEKRYNASRMKWVEAEPFVGGGGSLINMAKDFPRWKFHINDKNPIIVGFWKTVLGDIESFNKLKERVHSTTKVDLDFYYKVWDTEFHTDLGRAYKTLFLNKCSYSGILSGRNPIGGKEQKSKWKVDVYWNPPHLLDLLDQTRKLLIDRTLSINCLDYKTFFDKIKDIDKIDFVYADPPYLPYGHSLYGEDYGFTLDNLIDLTKELSSFPNWCLSINDALEVREVVKPNICVPLKTMYAGDARYREAERKKSGDEKEVKKKFHKQEIMVFPEVTEIAV